MRRAFLSIAAMAILATGAARGQELPVVWPRFGAPASPSAITVRFLAEARPTVAVLDRASILASTFAGTKRIETFARHEAATFPTISAALEAAAAPTFIGPDPLNAAAIAASRVDTAAEIVLSGLPPFVRTPGARAIAADRAIETQGETDLARLDALRGPDFDALYVAVQREGLIRLVALFRDYVQNGDDFDLRALAVHALPGLRARLDAMRA